MLYSVLYFIVITLAVIFVIIHVDKNKKKKKTTTTTTTKYKIEKKKRKQRQKKNLQNIMERIVQVLQKVWKQNRNPYWGTENEIEKSSGRCKEVKKRKRKTVKEIKC